MSFGDLKERKLWPEYQHAFEQMLQHTSTEWAPWWVVPADHKWVTRALVAAILTRSINDLFLNYPTVSDERRRQLEAARLELQGNLKDRKADKSTRRAAKEQEE